MPHDELSQFLISGGGRRTLSPEKLELMGKEAANLFLSQRVPLTDGVTKIAREVQDINVEQVKRICEFANTAVHLAKHDLDKTAGAESSYPQFDLADPARVFQNLSGGGRGAKMAQVDSNYFREPRKMKVADARREAALAALFGVNQVKMAHVSVDMAVDDVVSKKQDLVDLRASLCHSAEELDLLKKEAETLYYDAVKRHLLSGESFTDVVNAATKSGVSAEVAFNVLEPVVGRLIDEKVASVEQLSAWNAPAELSKVAHRVLNEEHPFVDCVRSLAVYADEIEKVALALDEVDDGLKAVTSFIKENFLAARAS